MDNKPPYTSIKPPKFKRGSSVLSRQKTRLSGYSSGEAKTEIGEHMEDKALRVVLSRKERQGHTHILGSTGTGKSKLLEHLIRQDIRNRRCGLCLIDPHGSLYDEIVLYASHHHPSLADRFVLFNPASELDHIVGFNPIAMDTDRMDYLLDSLISACLKAWGQDNTDHTPRITKWLENIFYTIIANDLTLLETAPLLNVHRNDQRSILLEAVNSDVILDDWNMFESSTQTQKQNLIEGAANRLRKFLRNDIIRCVIGQKDKVLDMQQIMDEGKILLVNLNGAGRISNENTKLVGIMLVNEIFRVAKLRDPRDTTLKPFYFYIDEFAQFVTRDIARTLEEARKYRVFMTLAHQHLAQLQEEDEYLYASVLTNCKNKIVFGGLSTEDAEIMTDEITTGFLNLKTVKDEVYRIRERHIEERRTVITKNRSESDGETWGESEGTSEAQGETEGVSTGHTEGRSRGESHGESQGSTSSYTSGSTQSSGHSSSDSLTKGGPGMNQFGTGKTEASTSGNTYTSSHSTTNTRSHSNTKTESRSKTKTLGKSKSQSKGGSKSKTKGESMAEVPFLRPEEVEELSSREFWSKDDLRYMQMGEIKNQDVAEAYIKIGSKPPIKTRIDFVSDVFFSPRTSPKRIERFRQKLIKANDGYYTPMLTARKAYQERQRLVFGEPLRFDEVVMLPEDEESIIEGESEQDQNPFTAHE